MNIKNSIKNVIKSNNLVLSHFKMTLHEQKILVLCISKIKKEDKKDDYIDLTFKLTVEEMSKFLLLSKRTLYKDLENISARLMRYLIEIRNENGEFEKIRPFPYARYEDGIFTLRFEQSMKDYLMELKDKFTIYDIENVRYLKSNYSMRMYEILKSYEWINHCVIELDELKKLVGVIGITDDNYIDLYTRYNDFKRYVLVTAQKELEEKTDIKFEFQEIKKGRKVMQIEFIISSNANNMVYLMPIEEAPAKKISQREVVSSMEEIAAEIASVDIDDLIDQLQAFISEPLKIKDLKAILKAADNDVKLIQTKYELAKQQSHIENLTAWLIAAVKSDYTEPISRTKNNKFVNYKQENYDFDKLEQLERERIKKEIEKDLNTLN